MYEIEDISIEINNSPFIEEKNESGIYAIVNTFNGHRYVGSAVNLSRRWKEHKKQCNKNIHRNNKLQSSWNAFGEKCFNFIILELCSRIKLIDREQHYIDTLKPEYNICLVAGNLLGFKRSEESKEKMRGENNPNYGKTGKNHPSYGKKHSEEVKQKQREKMVGENNPMYGKTGENSPSYGIKRSEETKEKIGKNNPNYGKTKLSKNDMLEITKQYLAKEHSLIYFVQKYNVNIKTIQKAVKRFK